MIKNIAITGSSGFIGNLLKKKFIKNTYNIFEIDLKNGIDISKKNSLKKLPRLDLIIHLAAKSFVPKSFEKPYSYYNNNINSTLNLLEYARLNNCGFVFFSSYLYGTPEYLPIDEKHPIKPHNPYAQSKIICEKLCEGYHRDFNIPIIILRPFNIYGPNQQGSFLIPHIINQLSTKTIKLKDPRPKRDFINVYDVVEAVYRIIETGISGYEIFNLGFGKSYSVNEIVQTIVKLHNTPIEIKFTNEFRKNEILDTVADISKLKRHINWIPSINISKGLNDIIYNSEKLK